jgi:hypothetical protein
MWIWTDRAELGLPDSGSGSHQTSSRHGRAWPQMSELPCSDEHQRRAVDVFRGSHPVGLMLPLPVRLLASIARRLGPEPCDPRSRRAGTAARARHHHEWRCLAFSLVMISGVSMLDTGPPGTGSRICSPYNKLALPSSQRSPSWLCHDHTIAFLPVARSPARRCRTSTLVCPNLPLLLSQDQPKETVF